MDEKYGASSESPKLVSAMIGRKAAMSQIRVQFTSSVK